MSFDVAAIRRALEAGTLSERDRQDIDKYSRGLIDSMQKPVHTSDHDYLSTACFHEMHARCRKQCKFCEAWCLCSCHAGETRHDARKKQPDTEMPKSYRSEWKRQNARSSQ